MNKSDAVDFDINVQSNHTELVQVTGIVVTVSRARLRFTPSFRRRWVYVS